MARRDLLISLLIMAVVVSFALVGLATDHNWPKMLRVSLSFLAYGGTLIAFVRYHASRQGAESSIPWTWFATAAGTAGIVSGIVRPEFHWSVLLAGTVAGSLLFSTAHWLAIKQWRAIRSRIARIA